MVSRLSGKNVTIQTGIMLALLASLLASRIFIQNVYLEIFLILFLIGSEIFVYKFHKDRAKEALERASMALSHTKHAETLKAEVGHTDETLASIISEITNTVRPISSKLEEIVAFNRDVSSRAEQMSIGAEAQNFSLDETAKSIQGISNSIKNLVDMVEKLFPETEKAMSSIFEMVDSNKRITTLSRELLTQVRVVSSEIDEVVNSVKDMETRFGVLSSSSFETSKAVERIDSTIKEIERKARQSFDLGEEVRRDAEVGYNASSRTIDGMNAIREVVSESSKVIEKLGKKSGEIGDIIGVINEVTDRTNLLALNASIIAAQAGEHGKGFAVVAGEIKRLAEQTASSTVEISTLIKSIQSMVADAVQANELGTWSVEEGVRLSNETGVALKKILEGTGRSSEMSKDIADATVNQSEEARAVLKTIHDEVKTIQEAAAAIRDHVGRSRKIKQSAAKMVAITQDVTKANMEQEKANANVTAVIEQVKNTVSGMFDITRNQRTDSEQIIQAVEVIEFITAENTKAVRGLSSVIKELKGKVEAFDEEFKGLNL